MSNQDEFFDEPKPRNGKKKAKRTKKATAPNKSKRVKKLDKVRALISHFEDKASTEEAIDKFSEIVVAEHGRYDEPDEIVVMGYFDPIEGVPTDPLPDDADIEPNGFILDGDGQPFDYVYDLSMESLGMALQKLGVRTISENNYELDEATGKWSALLEKPVQISFWVTSRRRSASGSPNEREVAMGDCSEIGHDQFQQLLEQGHTPEEAAQILLESLRTIAEVCERLLEKLTSGDCEDLLKELSSLETTDDNKR